MSGQAMRTRTQLAVGAIVGAIGFYAGTQVGSSQSRNEADLARTAVKIQTKQLRTNALSDKPQQANIRPTSPGKQSFDPSTAPARSAARKAPAASSAVAARQKAKLAQLSSLHKQAQSEVDTLSQRIEALETEAGLNRTRHEYELNADDWRTLGEHGTLKVRMPCNGGKITDQVMTKLGLQKKDAVILRAAQRASAARMWKVLLPLCEHALGNAETAKLLGPNACKHRVINASVNSKDRLPALRRTAAYWAGDAPAALEAERTDLDKLFLAMTSEAGQFEADIAVSLGNSLAHEVTFSDGLCFGVSIFQMARQASKPDGPRGRAEY